MKIYATRTPRSQDSESIFHDIIGKDLWVKVHRIKGRPESGYFRLVSHKPGGAYYYNFVPEWGLGTGYRSIALEMMNTVMNGGYNVYEITKPVEVLTTEELKSAIINGDPNE